MSLALISVTRDIAERTSFGRAIKEESGFVYFSAQLLPNIQILLPVGLRALIFAVWRSVAIVLPTTRPNLRNAFDLSPSAAEPHMNVLAFHSERRCEILDGKTLVTCLLERCQD